LAKAIVADRKMAKRLEKVGAMSQRTLGRREEEARPRLFLPADVSVFKWIWNNLSSANNLQQSWRFDREPPKAVLRDVWTIDWILGC
jgi:hypothetical protein